MKTKYLFFLTLLTQTLIVVAYFIIKTRIVEFYTVNMDNLQGFNSTFLINNSFPRNTSKSTITMKYGSSDLQKQFIHKVNESFPINSTKTTEIFQQIDDQQEWVYSAFVDHVAAQAGKPLVRVISVLKCNAVKGKVYCSYINDSGNLTSTGIVVPIPDFPGKLYCPAFLECSLSDNDKPSHVSVSFKADVKPTNRLQIIYPGARFRNFTVCYSVLHSNYNKVSQLIESIELNRVLGAEHFMVYNYSVSPQVDQILSRYQEDGLLTVLPWPLPTLQGHYYLQITALNDCLYRNRNTSRFVAVVDTDEMIIPRNHNNWMDFIDSFSQQSSNVLPKSTIKKHFSCFVVRSSFFSNKSILDWDTLPSPFSFTDDEIQNITKHNISTLSQFWRAQKIFEPNDRSKYIANPNLVYMFGIHYVLKFTTKTQCMNIAPELALVHHYRCIKETNLAKDTTILKFKNKLYPRIIEQMKHFPTIFS